MHIILSREIQLSPYRHEDSSHPKYGHVVQDGLFLVREFQFCSFSHVKHIGNLVAYFLARKSKFGSKLQVWYNTIPDDIAPLITHDFL